MKKTHWKIDISYSEEKKIIESQVKDICDHTIKSQGFVDVDGKRDFKIGEESWRTKECLPPVIKRIIEYPSGKHKVV